MSSSPAAANVFVYLGKIVSFNCFVDLSVLGRCLEWEDPKRGIPKPASDVLEQYCAITGSGVTGGGGGQGAECPHETSAREISADLPGKEGRGKRGKWVNDKDH